MIRIVPVRLVVLGLVAFSLPLASQAGRSIKVTTVATFGGALDDPALELNGVSGAIRTDDGRFVVVNNKPSEVRVYAPSGRIESVIGRVGEGPGEFRGGAPILRHWPGDSVLVFSQGSRRWMLFSLDAKLVREWQLGEDEQRPFGAQLVGGAFTLNNLGDGSTCLNPLIRRLAPATGPLHQGMIDEDGRIWLRRADADLWRVHSPGGELIGTIDLPGFVPTSLQDDHLVGVREDSDGFLHVVAITTQLPGSRVTMGDCSDPLPQGSRGSEIRSLLRNMLTGAEMHFANYRRYPRDIKEVPGLQAPPGIEAAFTSRPDGNGYAASAWESASGFRCLISVGYAIRLLPDGVIACGG